MPRFTRRRIAVMAALGLSGLAGCGIPEGGEDGEEDGDDEEGEEDGEAEGEEEEEGEEDAENEGEEGSYPTGGRERARRP